MNLCSRRYIRKAIQSGIICFGKSGIVLPDDVIKLNSANADQYMKDSGVYDGDVYENNLLFDDNGCMSLSEGNKNSLTWFNDEVVDRFIDEKVIAIQLFKDMNNEPIGIQAAVGYSGEDYCSAYLFQDHYGSSASGRFDSGMYNGEISSTLYVRLNDNQKTEMLVVFKDSNGEIVHTRCDAIDTLSVEELFIILYFADYTDGDSMCVRAEVRFEFDEDLFNECLVQNSNSEESGGAK